MTLAQNPPPHIRERWSLLRGFWRLMTLHFIRHTSALRQQTSHTFHRIRLLLYYERVALTVFRPHVHK